MTLVAKNLDTPDEKLAFPNGSGNVVTFGEMNVGRGHMEPGWRWKNDVAPLVGASSCQLPHTGLVLEGHLHIEMDDGAELDLHPGDVYVISPGHDGWVVGDKPVRTLEWSGSALHFLDPVT